MFTLADISPRRALARWAGVSAFCALFGFCYEQFSHGVTSPFMAGLFLFPLLGGAAPCLLLWALRRARLPAGGAALYRAGLATLILGSALRGVFDIYGTTSALAAVYWWVGGALCAAGAAAVFRAQLRG